MANNNKLKILETPNVEIIGYCFLHDNKSLKRISLPNILSVGERFLYMNKGINLSPKPLLDFVINEN